MMMTLWNFSRKPCRRFPPPPETFDAYAKQGEATNGVMTMMDIIVADLDKEMREADVDEKDGGDARFGGHEQNPQ